MSNTLNLGTDGNWAVKKDSLLAYNSENGNFKPLPFDFTRASSATVVNKDGLIEVVGSGKARIDFKDDAKGALLLEPTSSNLFTYSQDFSNAYWVKVDASLISSSTISLDGNLSAYLLEATSAKAYLVVSNTLTETQRTASIFAKKGNYDKFKMGQASNEYYAEFDLTNGTILSINGNLDNAYIEDYGNNWYKCSITYSSPSGAKTFGIILDGLGNNINIFGAQLEQSSYPTSYIPTQGSAVTRVADVCNNAGNEQVINSTEGVLYIEMKSDFNDSATKRISISDFTNNNRLTLYFNVSTNIIGTVIVTALGGSPSSLSYSVPSFSTYNKIALKYKTNDYALWVNGVEVDTELIGNTFAPNVLKTIRFEQGAGGLHYFYGNTKDVRVYNTALTDAELISLTTI